MSTEAPQKKAWVYDVECYPNFFSALFIHQGSEEEHRFIIFHDMRDASLSINQFKELMAFVNSEVRTLIGYNSQGYDDLLIKHLIMSYEFFKSAGPGPITQSLKALSDKIIGMQSRKGERDAWIDNLKSRKLFGSIDLLLLFNTINRVGLKQIAINLRWPEIIDLPHPPNHIVVREEVEEIMYYNRNDVRITKALLKNRSEVIQYRRDYTADYGTNVINANDTNIAKIVIRKYYSEVSGRKYEDFKDQRTFRTKVVLRHCISPRVTFMSKPYQEALNKFRNTEIDPNKLDNEEKKNKKKQFEHILRTKYLTHTLGLGGIHSNNPAEILEENEEYEYIDVDVASYYPSILIEENLYPHHLGPELVTVYRDKLFYPRLQAKKEGKTAFAEMLKIALNSSFGLTKSAHSWLYDPNVTLSITVNGQLFLMMLMERLEYYSDCQVVYSNTDGLTVKVPRHQRDLFMSICKQWEEYTRFGLEYVNYKKMIMRDVNSYMMVTYSDDPKKAIKVKGVFQDKMPITAGYDFPVIAKALKAYYEKGVSPEVYIKSENDIYEFMKAERTSMEKYEVSFRTLANPKEAQRLNKNNRWIVTRGNPQEGKLRKKSIIEYIVKRGQVTDKKNKRFNIPVEMQKDRYVAIVNDLSNPYSNISQYRLDYDYYIGEVYKVIKTIRKNRGEGTAAPQVQQMSLL